MIFNRTEKQEKKYLQQVISIINATINSTNKSVKEHVDTLQEYKDYLWSNKDIDPHEIRSMRESILHHFARGENVIDKRNRLSKILDIPYFGRIDFKEKKDGSKSLPVYIGIHTFFDFNNKRNLIYDCGHRFRVCSTIMSWAKRAILLRRRSSWRNFTQTPIPYP